MNFGEYQVAAGRTALYPKGEHGWVYPALGLANEAGEVAGKLKKVLRDNNGVVDAERKETIAAELGDVLWYVAQVATELDLEMDAIAAANIAKLASRAERGALKGDGDKR